MRRPAPLCRLLPVCLAMLLTPAAADAQLTLRDEITTPTLTGFRPLPPEDRAFSAALEPLVRAAALDEMTPAADNPDGEDEWASICLVDLSGPGAPRVAGWKAENFVYPASTYKMYVLGEAIRQVVEGRLHLDDAVTVAPHNEREGDRLRGGQTTTLAEVLRLMSQHSDNTAANVAIDTVDRQRASALLRAMGLRGSDITRKFLPRSREDAGYAEVPGTTTCALHQATFLWAAESGAIGGGRGRGLIRGFLATCETGRERFRAGLPDSATLLSKTGEWDTFTAQAAIVEDGPVRYILCVMTAMPEDKAAPRMARFAAAVHAMMRAGEAGRARGE